MKPFIVLQLVIVLLQLLPGKGTQRKEHLPCRKVQYRPKYFCQCRDYRTRAQIWWWRWWCKRRLSFPSSKHIIITCQSKRSHTYTYYCGVVYSILLALTTVLILVRERCLRMEPVCDREKNDRPWLASRRLVQWSRLRYGYSRYHTVIVLKVDSTRTTRRWGFLLSRSFGSWMYGGSEASKVNIKKANF